MTSSIPSWSVYILRCSDGSFYVGHTADVHERLSYHSEGRGPVYTAVRRPVQLVFAEEHESLESALKRERQLKRWTRAKKDALIAEDPKRLHALAKRRH
jgi:predicted GIY-YIG superfamily endonuclease